MLKLALAAAVSTLAVTSIAHAQLCMATYEVSGNQSCIEIAEAACLAACTIAGGTWLGVATDMDTIQVRRSPGCPSGYSAAASGTATVPMSEVPPGATIR